MVQIGEKIGEIKLVVEDKQRNKRKYRREVTPQVGTWMSMIADLFDK